MNDEDNNGKQSNYLNIYCNYASEPAGKDLTSELGKVAENCQTFELEYVPFQLTHYETMGRKVFVLLGGDCRVHIFSRDDHGTEFSERNLENYLPEFQSLHTVPTYIDVEVTSDEKRVSVIGLADGLLLLYVTDLSTDEWTRVEYQIQHGSPITSVKLFNKRSYIRMPEFLRRKFAPQTCMEPLREDFHLLVTSARESAVVYCFCEEQGFNIPIFLDKSDEYGCVTCCAITDLDRDGVNEILVGTYGQELLVYKFSEPTLEMEGSHRALDPLSFAVGDTKSFCCPIINVKVLDINDDGLDEVVVITSKGLHVLQCDMKAASAECVRKLRKMKIFMK